jgi:hypothetical protein
MVTRSVGVPFYSAENGCAVHAGRPTSAPRKAGCACPVVVSSTWQLLAAGTVHLCISSTEHINATTRIPHPRLVQTDSKFLRSLKPAELACHYPFTACAQSNMPAQFPPLTGGCFCGSVRYRMEEPLFVYACHCSDCQKWSGSVFACFATCEARLVTAIGETPPKFVTSTREAKVRVYATCPECGNRLWSRAHASPATVDIRIGTLDMPSCVRSLYVTNDSTDTRLPCPA